MSISAQALKLFTEQYLSKHPGTTFRYTLNYQKIADNVLFSLNEAITFYVIVDGKEKVVLLNLEEQ